MPSIALTNDSLPECANGNRSWAQQAPRVSVAIATWRLHHLVIVLLCMFCAELRYFCLRAALTVVATTPHNDQFLDDFVCINDLAHRAKSSCESNLLRTCSGVSASAPRLAAGLDAMFFPGHGIARLASMSTLQHHQVAIIRSSVYPKSTLQERLSVLSAPCPRAGKYGCT